MRLFSPCTTNAKVVLFDVNVGAEGEEPSSGVQPEKTSVVGLMLLNQSDAPSDPVTTTYRVFPTSEAAGLSTVVPEGNADQPLQVCDAMV